MSRISEVIVAVSLAVLCLAAAPSNSFDAWLSETVQLVIYYVPAQRVFILVEKTSWDARMVKAADTKERDVAIRRAVCFGLYDHNATRWEWDPAKSGYEVYTLQNNVKSVLATGDILNCTVEDATDIWHQAGPSHPAKHHYF